MKITNLVESARISNSGLSNELADEVERLNDLAKNVIKILTEPDFAIGTGEDPVAFVCASYAFQAGVIVGLKERIVELEAELNQKGIDSGKLRIEIVALRAELGAAKDSIYRITKNWQAVCKTAQAQRERIAAYEREWRPALAQHTHNREGSMGSDFCQDCVEALAAIPESEEPHKHDPIPDNPDLCRKCGGHYKDHPELEKPDGRI